MIGLPPPGNPSPAPAVVPSFDQGVHKIDLPARGTPTGRPVIPVDQLRDAPTRIPKSTEQPPPDPLTPLCNDAPPPAEMPAVFSTLSSLANVPAQQWDAFRVLADAFCNSLRPAGPQADSGRWQRKDSRPPKSSSTRRRAEGHSSVAQAEPGLASTSASGNSRRPLSDEGQEEDESGRSTPSSS